MHLYIYIYIYIYIYHTQSFIYGLSLQLDWTFLMDKGDNLDLRLASEVRGAGGGQSCGAEPSPCGI